MIPDSCDIVPEISESGDDCHYDIFKWNKAHKRETAKAIKPEECFICDEPLRHTTTEEVISLKIEYLKERQEQRIEAE